MFKKDNLYRQLFQLSYTFSSSSLFFILLSVYMIHTNVLLSIRYLIYFIGLTLLLELVLCFSKYHFEKVKIRVREATNVSSRALLLVPTYLFPLQYRSEIEIMLYLLVICIIDYFTGVYYYNPILILFGYRIYDISTSEGYNFILLTKVNLEQINSTENELEVIQLGKHFLLGVSKSDSCARK